VGVVRKRAPEFSEVFILPYSKGAHTHGLFIERILSREHGGEKPHIVPAFVVSIVLRMRTAAQKLLEGGSAYFRLFVERESDTEHELVIMSFWKIMRCRQV
jgi:hypothetical protein